MKHLRNSAYLLLALVVAAPLAAQQSVPLDIVPLTPVRPSPVEFEAIADEVAAPETLAPTGAPELIEAATGDAAAIEVESVEVESVEVEVVMGQVRNPQAVGLIEEDEGGFPYDMWRGSDRALIERLLPRLPAGATSRAMNDLARRLLLTIAAPPGGPMEENLLAIRIERLAAMGDSVAMNLLMRSAPPDLYDTALVQTRLDSLLLIADYVGACTLARDLVRRDDTPYWEKVLIFCQALNERHDAAALGLSLLRERNVEEYPGFDLLLMALAGELCDGRIVIVLEGGYDLVALPWGVRTVIETLLGESPTPDPLGTLTPERAPDIAALLEEVRRLHGLE